MRYTQQIDSTSQGRRVMEQSATSENTVTEREVRITWRQWPDGRWEAWITDENGVPPRLARNQAELERFLAPSHEPRELERRSAEAIIPNN
jgi:hypothetical protein